MFHCKVQYLPIWKSLSSQYQSDCYVNYVRSEKTECLTTVMLTDRIYILNYKEICQTEIRMSSLYLNTICYDITN